jgi:2-amino-4-hydroxy-6-hydroxymethyldihydropteridine diphosphokinase
LPHVVAELEPNAGPHELLDRLLAVERELGRVRDGTRWGPRTIDLDLLVYGSETLDEPRLTLPHPRMHERLFVLEPLAELAPDLALPGRGTVRELVSELHSTS